MRHFTAGLLALIAVLVLSCDVSACPRGRSYVRACYANQKTIAGALEMYALDNNLPASGQRARRLMKQDYQPLVDGGYLQSIPADPGQYPAALENYVLLQDGAGIACLVHGTIEDQGRRPAREQLAARGVSDPAILEAALDTLPPSPKAPFPFWILALAAAMGAIQELLGRMMRWLHGGPSSFGAFLVAGRALAGFTLLLTAIPAWRHSAELPLVMQGFFLFWLTLPASGLMAVYAFLRWVVARNAAPQKWPAVLPVARSRRPAPARVTAPVPGVKLLAMVSTGEARCPICGDRIGVAPSHCEDCHTPHHRECFIYNGCCGMYGCGSIVQVN